MGILRMILAFLRTFVASCANLAAENVLLRQQLIVLQRSVPRLKLRRTDRVLLCWLSRLWSDWRSALPIVQPSTVIKWHRHGFKLYWHWKSRKKQGRPKVNREIRDLIQRMCRENSTWGGAPSKGWRVSAGVIGFRKSNVSTLYPNGDGSLDARMRERSLS